MTTTSGLPPVLRRHLEELERLLAPQPFDYRREVLDGVREHIAEALAEGATPAEIVVRLGDPASLAAQAGEQGAPEAEPSRTRPGMSPARVLQLVAAALALGVTVFVILVTPAYTTVTTSMSSAHEASGESPAPDLDVVVTQETVWMLNAPYILIFAAIPTLLALVPLLARGRAWRPVSITSTALLVVVATAFSASFGWFLAPALLAAVIALVVPGPVSRS